MIIRSDGTVISQRRYGGGQITWETKQYYNIVSICSDNNGGCTVAGVTSINYARLPLVCLMVVDPDCGGALIESANILGPSTSVLGSSNIGTGIVTNFELSDSVSMSQEKTFSDMPTFCGSEVNSNISIMPSSIAFIANNYGPASPSQRISLSTTSSNNPVWDIRTDVNWLSASPNSGEGPSDINIRVTAIGLSPGNYIGNIYVSSPNSVGGIQAVAVSLRVLDPPKIQLSRNDLFFGAIQAGVKTQSQDVFISNLGASIMNWTATPSETWITVNPRNGTEDGKVVVDIDASGFPAGIYKGTITFSDPVASNSPRQLTVTLSVYSEEPSTLPYGFVDTPIDGTAGISGAIPVTGWALDNIEVVRIELKRDAHQEDPVAALGPEGLVYIGEGIFVEGARQDIELIYQGVPFNSRGGWGYMLLTNMLPGRGNGTFRLHAFAYDKEGNKVVLGTSTIICDNAHSAKPFGTIDTPVQGGVASGNRFVNFGWVLTPQPNMIPLNGSTLGVWVDGVRVGGPAYNNYRSDIAELHPGYVNSGGAVGYYFLDTTTYSNGVHTLAWSAVDTGGNADGIGSRYFVISNIGGSAQYSNTALADALERSEKGKKEFPLSAFDVSTIPISPFPIKIKEGFDLSQGLNILKPDNSGIFNVMISEVSLLEIELSSLLEYSCSRGYLKVGSELRSLPVGSTLNSRPGRFLWMPGPGFLGDYDFVFLVNDKSGIIRKIPLKVTIKPEY